MELVDGYRDHHLLGARMIAKNAAELAQSAGVTLTRIEWLHGHEIADWSSSSLKLEAGNRVICKAFPDEWIDSFPEEGDKGPPLAMLQSMIDTLSREVPRS